MSALLIDMNDVVWLLADHPAVIHTLQLLRYSCEVSGESFNYLWFYISVSQTWTSNAKLYTDGHYVDLWLSLVAAESIYQQKIHKWPFPYIRDIDSCFTNVYAIPAPRIFKTERPVIINKLKMDRSSWTYAWVIKTKVHSLQKQIQGRMAESDYCNKYTKQTVTSTQKNRLLT